MILKPFQGKSPKIDPTAWIAENAVVIGDVTIGPRASIWYHAVLRGDTGRIVIGEETNIQDGAILHAETVQGPCLIGRRVTIGHNAVVHGCVVEDDVLIGIGATVLSYAKIGAGSLIAAGALIKENEQVPPRTLMVGVPAKPRGMVTDERLTQIKLSAEHYLELAEEYRRGSCSLHATPLSSTARERS